MLNGYRAEFLKSQGILTSFEKYDHEFSDNPGRIPEVQDDGTHVYIYFEDVAAEIAAEQIAKMLYGNYCVYAWNVTG